MKSHWSFCTTRKRKWPKTVSLLAVFSLLSSILLIANPFVSSACWLPMSFHVETTVTVSGGAVRALALGDLNNDGKLDLVATTWDSTLTVLLGNGDGTFDLAGARAYKQPGWPSDIVLADFNGDGKLDIATADSTGNTCSWSLNDGGGNFNSWSSLPVGTWPSAIASGDFDRDGDIDLAVACDTSNRIYTPLNHIAASNTFTDGGWLNGATNPADLDTGDLNKDGYSDIVVAEPANRVAVFAQTAPPGPAGAFDTATYTAVSRRPFAIKLGDLNHDSKLDLVTGNTSSTSIRLGKGNLALGEGGFYTETSYTASEGTATVTAVELGDLNNDSLVDLVTANFAAPPNAAIGIRSGYGSWLFSCETTLTIPPGSSAPVDIALGDLNNDGRKDIVAGTDSSSANIVVYLNGGKYSYDFAWYDCKDMKTWILIGNPSATESVYFDIYIAGVYKMSKTLGPGQTYYASFPGVVGGPVTIVANKPLYTTLRSLYSNSFCEVPGDYGGTLSTKHYFPWYDCQGMKTWILVSNPNEYNSATFTIYLGGAFKETQTLGPGKSYYAYYPGVMGGPVKVLSDKPVAASERSLYGCSFSEVYGITEADLATSYYFPWYDCQGMKTWILVSNPSEVSSATFDIYVGGAFKETQTLGPGQSYYALYPGVMGGPVKITSNIPVYATQRSLFPYEKPTSFNELAGLASPGALAKKFYFPWYDCQSMKTWILVANPSLTTTAYIDLYIGTSQKVFSYAISPGNRQYFKFDGVMGGPVKIISNTNIYATQRSLYPISCPASFWEVSGLTVP